MAIANFARTLDDSTEFDVGSGVEIEDEATRNFGLARFAIPGVELNAPDLCNRGEPLDAVDLQIWFLVAKDLNEFEQRGAPAAVGAGANGRRSVVARMFGRGGKG